MNATEKQITVFVCGTCTREHDNRDHAESCCVCCDCEKRSAVVKSAFGEKLCEQCHIVRNRKRVRGSIATLQGRLAKQLDDLHRTKRELAQAEAELKMLGGKTREERAAKATP